MFQVLPTIESASNTEPPSLSPSFARLTAISPLPDLRRDSACEDSESVLNLPVPTEFADSRRSSAVQQPLLCNDPNESQQPNEQDALNSKQRTVSTEALDVALDDKLFVEDLDEASNILFQDKNTTQDYDDKECSSILSAISNEEISITSDILDQKSFCPRKNSDGEDVNGHICHIDSPETDTYPNSEALHGESLMDDMSSMLGMTGCDQDSGENTFTDDTTLFTSDFMEKRESRKGLRKESFDKRHSLRLDDDNTQFGFENRAFVPSLMLEKDNKDDELKYMEPTKYCSLAQFVEGNDIARRSFRRHKPATKLSKTEANVNRQSILAEENEPVSRKGSVGSLHKLDKIDSNKISEPPGIFPQVSVIVEPPSPVLSERMRLDRVDKLLSPTHTGFPTIRLGSEYDLIARLEIDGISSKSNSNHSSQTNLLQIDTEQMQYLGCSPAATRRISSGSLLKAHEAAALAASASSIYADKFEKKKEETEKTTESKKLPIINPLVRLPSWPRKSTYVSNKYDKNCLFLFSLDVSGGSGLISKCLLANADALCAAVSPLMDPDETLLEGFFERCVMNNYFGIGIDAKISLDFHHKREEHPEKCRSRAKNYMWYGVLGSKQWLQKTYKNLEQRVQLECDGQRIPLPSLQGIVILNIPR